MSTAAPTKAEALQSVVSHLLDAHVPPFVFWTVDDWHRRRRTLVAICVTMFGGSRVAVRSATRDEDRAASGLAGHYRTELDVVADAKTLAHAVDRVIADYPCDRQTHHVIVQAMVQDARRCGVVVTHDPSTGAPYDVIELADGPRTDVVTSGCDSTTRVSIHRGTDPSAVARAGFTAIIRAVRAVEAASARNGPLEIELAERSDGTIAVLQFRPLAASVDAIDACERRVAQSLRRLTNMVERLGRPRRGLAGTSTILGLMPDWNPAELIGAHPAPLAMSLFRVLLSNTTWQEARASMGYQAVPRTPLVRSIAGRPYVDVRASFNSFVPAGLAFGIRTALVDAWMAHLRARPELHDRVELEVAETVLDFDTLDGSGRRFGAAAPRGAQNAWLASLAALTARAIDLTPGSSLPRALRTVARLDVPDRDGKPGALGDALAALERCRVEGARPFAVVARHAFMAESLLRTLVTREALRPERLVEFRRSLTTVTRCFTEDWGRVARGTLRLSDFLEAYGHLRPGAFDVTSLPYALRDREGWAHAPASSESETPFELRAHERAATERLLGEIRLRCGADTLFAWASTAIVGREDAKFGFARGLSSVLEGIARWGAEHGLEREELALLTVVDFRRAAAADRLDTGRLRARVIAVRKRRGRERELRLGPLIRDAADLTIVYEPPALPTFITTRNVVASPVQVDGHTIERCDVAGKIVCIESADPGYDWIFGRGISGLVTRFGGVNSHMAVRCLELGVAAALGVGERVFERVSNAAKVELRCGEGVVREEGLAAGCAR